MGILSALSAGQGAGAAGNIGPELSGLLSSLGGGAGMPSASTLADPQALTGLLSSLGGTSGSANHAEEEARLTQLLSSMDAAGTKKLDVGTGVKSLKQAL